MWLTLLTYLFETYMCHRLVFGFWGSETDVPWCEQLKCYLVVKVKSQSRFHLMLYHVRRKVLKLVWMMHTDPFRLTTEPSLNPCHCSGLKEVFVGPRSGPVPAFPVNCQWRAAVASINHRTNS